MSGPFDPPAGDPAALLTAAAALLGVAATLRSRTQSLGVQVGGTVGTWTCTRANSFRAAGAQPQPRLQEAETAVAELASILRELAARLRALIDEVEALRRLGARPEDQARCETAALLAKREHAAYLTTLPGRVGSILPSPPGSGPGQVDLVTIMLLASSPRQVAAWWRGLGAAGRRAVVRDHPDLVGGLDGLPGWARDAANRARIATVRSALVSRLGQIRAAAHGYEPYGRGLTLPGREEADIAGKLRALDELQRVLALPERHLLVLEAESGHQLHAAVAVGDVDAARDVGVFVPGLDSNVEDSLGVYDAEMATLRQRAGRSSSATVTWLGYDAPQLDDALTGTLSVASDHLARQGGDHLADFLAGLDTARSHDVHLTALGHSYGSVTTGYALQHPHTGVDDAVFFGSPGASTDHREDLHVPEGHLFDLVTYDDPVAITERFGTLPTLMPGFQVLSTGPARTPGGALLIGVAGHTHYLTNSSTSQWNIAAVVSGRPDLAVVAPAVSQPEHLARF